VEDKALTPKTAEKLIDHNTEADSPNLTCSYRREFERDIAFDVGILPVAIGNPGMLRNEN